MSKPRTWAAAAAAILAVSCEAQAALHDRGAGLIYDDVLNITWLQDWNYAKTSGYADGGALPGWVYGRDVIWTDGRMGWNAARQWAEDLHYFDSVRNVSWSDWRLPTVSPVNGSFFQYELRNNGSADIGYAKTGAGGGWGLASEMGHVYYVALGNNGYCAPNDASPGGCDEQSDWGLTNTGLFQNMQSSCYWPGTEYAPNPGSAWTFCTDLGQQNYDGQHDALYAVAVRPGDVALVPEPQSVAMLLAGLGVLAVTARRRGR